MIKHGFVARLVERNGKPVGVIISKGEPFEIFIREWQKMLGREGYRIFDDYGMNKHIGKG